MPENTNIYYANMTLPLGGKTLWTRFMRAQEPIQDRIDIGSPIAQSIAEFGDGTTVIGGVAKSTQSDEFNIKFMWVFDDQGQQYSDWPIDTTDHEDFYQTVYPFRLSDIPYDDHFLHVLEVDEYGQLADPKSSMLLNLTFTSDSFLDSSYTSVSHPIKSSEFTMNSGALPSKPTPNSGTGIALAMTGLFCINKLLARPQEKNSHSETPTKCDYGIVNR